MTMLVNFSWIREGKVAGMGLPYGEGWAKLAEEGVRAVLSLTEHPVRITVDEELETLHVPLVDFGTPAMEDLERCVAWIQEQVAAGRPVAVHCFAGIGRTGTVLAAYMVAEGAEPQSAIEEIRSLRPGSIETEGQADAVRRFAERDPS